MERLLLGAKEKDDTQQGRVMEVCVRSCGAGVSTAAAEAAPCSVI
jgi:hypothetical protein